RQQAFQRYRAQVVDRQAERPSTSRDGGVAQPAAPVRAEYLADRLPVQLRCPDEVLLVPAALLDEASDFLGQLDGLGNGCIVHGCMVIALRDNAQVGS